MIKKKISLKKKIKKYMKLIIDNNYECYLVGGAVRDYLLNIKNKDYDLCTNMPLNKLKEIIPNVTIMKENEHRNTCIIREKDYDIEFTTFRGKNLKEDLSNRDFTMNSIAVDINGNIIDYFNGIESINKKTIKLIKENGEGLTTDPLRILRAIRQASKYDFKIDDNTKRQMNNKKTLLSNVAPERIYEELKKIIISNNIDFYLIEYKEIFFELIPELKKCDGFNQYNDYHIHDVYKHTVNVVNNSPKNIYVRFAALFHDIGKPEKLILDDNGIGHFLNHSIESNEIFKQFANMYKIDNKTKKIVSDLILYHEDTLSDKNNKIYNFYKKYNMNNIELLFDLKKADTLGLNPKYKDILKDLEKLENKYIKIRARYNEIEYKGSDLILLGYNGKIIGDILDDVKRQIINNALVNEKTRIEKYVLKNYNNKG